jgi:Rrf2 family cysteine metabolism transcriptional repressor
LNISTRGRYGVRALIEIALNVEQGPVRINSIAQKQRIPVSYLEQILNKLRKSEVIKSVRGSKGGYLLNKPKDEITVREVIAVLDGPFAVADCSKDRCPRVTCIGPESCVASRLWRKVEDNLDNFLGSITLEDLFQDTKKLRVRQKTERV